MFPPTYHLEKSPDVLYPFFKKSRRKLFLVLFPAHALLVNEPPAALSPSPRERFQPLEHLMRIVVSPGLFISVDTSFHFSSLGTPKGSSPGFVLLSVRSAYPFAQGDSPLLSPLPPPRKCLPRKC